MKKIQVVFILIFLSLIGSVQTAFPHCDTMDGPVIADAKNAIAKNNINYILKWVKPENESEIKDIFKQIMKVRSLNADAKELADKYFFDTVVRIHREGEGVPFTGVKPSGIPIDEKIKAADKSIESGNLSPLENLVSKEKMPELKELFSKAMSLKNFNVDNVQAGREYIEAYVQFFHFAEGEEEMHAHGHGHASHIEHLITSLPLVLSVIFFITSLVFAVLYFKNKKKVQ